MSTFENKLLNEGWKKQLEKNFTKYIAHISNEIERCEAVNFDMDQCRVEVHWKPFYLRCDYCNIDFDIIGKVETFEDDVKLIMERAGLTDLLLNSGEIGTIIKAQ